MIRTGKSVENTLICWIVLRVWNQMAAFLSNLTTSFFWIWHESKNGRTFAYMTNIFDEPDMKQRWQSFCYMTMLWLDLTLRTEMAAFPLHDGRCHLIWHGSEHGWIFINMMQVSCEFDMKMKLAERKWLNFQEHDNVVVGFDLKAEMAEFPIPWQCCGWIWHENTTAEFSLDMTNVFLN